MEDAIKGWNSNGHFYERGDGKVRVNVWHDPSEPRPFGVRQISENGVWITQKGRFKTAAAAMKKWGSK